ncbi:hypothetical protein KFU94_23030 [Chloroflexi bacterium TSY]|nr:hypothetical protein [Chloroflexi bacterium TSY]
MGEKLIEYDELLLDTPYLRRIREEGREEGIHEGATKTLCRKILDAFVWHFDPSVPVYREVEKHLTKIASENELDELFTAVLQSAKMDDSLAVLQEMVERNEVDEADACR